MKVVHIEVSGFRSYGAEPQRIDLTSSLVVIHADNSQGKTSFAEALEFLYTGTISRRQLGGGSPGEFQGSLRNAHLDKSNDVYIEVGLVDNDGNEHTIRRQLDLDYQGATDCTSTLTLNSVQIETVTEAGLQLSDPPLAAPVLLEHALRYAVSAKPGDRSDYFKAVLEVADLDTIRTEIAALIADRESLPRQPIIQKLDVLTSDPVYAPTLAVSRASGPESLAKAFLATLNSVLPPAPDEPPGHQPMQSAIDRVRRELASRQSEVIPLHQLRVGSAPPPHLRVEVKARERNDPDVNAADSSLGQQLESYKDLATTVERSVADLLPLLRAALRVDTLEHHEGDESIKCPLCETPDALSPLRIEAIRQQVADQEGLTQTCAAALEALNGFINDVEAIRNWTEQVTPPATTWSIDQRNERSTAVIEVGGNIQLFVDALQRTDATKAAGDALAEHARKAIELAENIREKLSQLLEITSTDISSLIESDAAVRGALLSQNALLAKAQSAAQACIDDVDPLLAARSKTDGWAVLIELASDTKAVWDALSRQSTADKTTARLKVAQRAIIEAIKKVLDRKLEVMGDEIRKWWSLMRPDELTAFDNISRRGAGNRYLDLTATLVPEPSGTGVIRNALAVLSNSQLNALGLAAFLARCQLLGSPVIFLDDPVPGSDREHRYTFAGSVVTELLQTGRQVIVTTHDAELARTLQTIHQHLSIDEYGATLLDPRQGTRIVRTGDDFEHLMLDASSQMSSPLPENRRAAGNSLRIATERLAKHILVAQRIIADEPTASLADYDNKNLKDLRPLVTAYAKAPNEAGQWTMLARILNDSDHDTDPPQPADLKTSYHTLREIKKRHKVSTSTNGLRV